MAFTEEIHNQADTLRAEIALKENEVAKIDAFIAKNLRDGNTIITINGIDDEYVMDYDKADTTALLNNRKSDLETEITALETQYSDLA